MIEVYIKPEHKRTISTEQVRKQLPYIQQEIIRLGVSLAEYGNYNIIDNRQIVAALVDLTGYVNAIAQAIIILDDELHPADEN